LQKGHFTGRLCLLYLLAFSLAARLFLLVIDATPHLAGMYILTPTYCVSKKILLRGRQPEPSDRETAGTTKYLAPPRSGFGLRRDEQFIAGLYQLFMAGGHISCFTKGPAASAVLA